MDHQLIEEIYRTYAREIRLYIYSLCGSAQGEDLLHDVFLRAILALPEDHPNFRAWLYQVARHTCINWLRRGQRERELLAPGEIKERENVRGYIESDILEQILTKERYRALYMAINRLPRIQKEVLILSYFGEMKSREISKVLGITEENVRVIAYRGRKALKKQLEQEGYHEL
ncbi:RNA polymerase sigma factor [bacterium 210820-DFI.6.37]|nr:RNA polymerase sigma factor [bacterium 210820-DFI.6.37]